MKLKLAYGIVGALALSFLIFIVVSAVMYPMDALRVVGIGGAVAAIVWAMWTVLDSLFVPYDEEDEL